MLPFINKKKDNIEVDLGCCVDDMVARWVVFRIESHSMLCLPPSPASETQPPP